MPSWRIDQRQGEERARHISALVLDVDGVLTDGRIYLGHHGESFQAFHVQDGLGLRLWQLAGYTVAVISGRSTDAVAQRCARLGITHVYQGVENKRAAFDEFLRTANVPPYAACVCGDDLLDLPLLHAAGLAAAVADAVPDVLAAAHLVTDRPGGAGAVRELIEFILRVQGRWSGVTSGLIFGNLVTNGTGSIQ